MSFPHLSLVIPVFNEADNLERLQEEIHTVLASGPWSYEVIYVDDGSTDDSSTVLHRLATRDEAVRTLRLERNSGQTAAFAAGFRAAAGEVIVTLDADLQNDPADIPGMLAALDTADVVCGVRIDRHDSWVRLASSRIANGARNRLTHESITDVGCSLRVMRSEFTRKLPLFDGMHRFLPTLLRLQGARVTEVPVRHRPRLHGRSKYGIQNRLWVGIADLFAVRWMIKRWIDPRLADEATPRRGNDTTS